MLSNLRTFGESSSCSTDGLACQVTITQADGSTRTFDAEEDGWCQDSAPPLISYAALKPFLDSLDCVFIRPGLFLDDLVPLDARCYDIVASGSRATSFQLSVDDVTRPLHLELDDCDRPALAGQTPSRSTTRMARRCLAPACRPALPGRITRAPACLHHHRIPAD